MNPAERAELGRLIAYTGQYYNRQLTREIVSMMVDDLEDLPFKEICAAYSEYRKNSKNINFPYPGAIRAIINPQLDDRQIAIEMARKIDKAITSHGYVWQGGYFSTEGRYWESRPGTKHSSFKEAVEAELGPLGWHAIASRGGWDQICQSQREMEEGTFIAQLRDQVQASHQLARQGIDITMIEMPTSTKIAPNEQLVAPSIVSFGPAIVKVKQIE